MSDSRESGNAVRLRKKLLEDQIMEAILAFNAQTGMSVNFVDVEFVDNTTASDNSRVYVPHLVTTTIT